MTKVAQPLTSDQRKVRLTEVEALLSLQKETGSSMKETLSGFGKKKDFINKSVKLLAKKSEELDQEVWSRVQQLYAEIKARTVRFQRQLAPAS